MTLVEFFDWERDQIERAVTALEGIQEQLKRIADAQEGKITRQAREIQRIVNRAPEGTFIPAGMATVAAIMDERDAL